MEEEKKVFVINRAVNEAKLDSFQVINTANMVKYTPEGKFSRITREDLQQVQYNNHFGLRTALLRINLQDRMQEIYDNYQADVKNNYEEGLATIDAELANNIYNTVMTIVNALENADEAKGPQWNSLPWCIWPYRLRAGDYVNVAFNITTTRDGGSERTFHRMFSLWPNVARSSNRLSQDGIRNMLAQALLTESDGVIIDRCTASFYVKHLGRHGAAGGNRNKPVFELKTLKSKKGVLTFNNKDKRCLLYATLLGCSYYSASDNEAKADDPNYISEWHYTQPHIAKYLNRQRKRKKAQEKRENRTVDNLVNELYNECILPFERECLLHPDLPLEDPTNYLLVERVCMRLEEYLHVRLIVYDSSELNSPSPHPLYSGNEQHRPCFVLLRYPTDDNQHHVCLATKPAAMFGTYHHHYCYKCTKPVTNASHHKCSSKKKCFLCYTAHETSTDKAMQKYCEACNRTFNNEQCFINHRVESIRTGKSMCMRLHCCTRCDDLYDPEDDLSHDEKGDHYCYSYVCSNCETVVQHDFDQEHVCSIQVPKPIEPTSLLMFVDIETLPAEYEETISGTQDKLLNRKLYPNVVCVQWFNFNPRDKESVKAMMEEKLPDPKYYQTFTSAYPEEKNAVDKYIHWMCINHAQFANATIICHNGRGFDFHFIKEASHKHSGLLLQATMRQGLIMRLHCKKFKWRFIDSYNFLSFPLAKFPKSFGFNSFKGDYPHPLNDSAFWDKTLDWPALDVWHIDDLAPEERVSKIKDLFLMMSKYNPHLDDKYMRIIKLENNEGMLKWWWDQWRVNCKWDNSRILIDYCVQDVTVLRMGCVRFMQVFKDAVAALYETDRAKAAPEFVATMEQCDPFSFTTIASACMFVHQRYCMPVDSIIAYRESTGQRTQSYVAMEWLSWVADSENRNIQTACSSPGECKVGRYFVDGIDYENKVAYEFKGCYWHGHHYTRCAINKRRWVGRHELGLDRVRDRDTVRDLDLKHKLGEQGFKYEYIWECEWHKLKKDNEVIRKTLKEQEDNIQFKPMNPRDGQFGGRVETFKPYVDFTTLNMEGRCGDVCSEYPFVMAAKPYPGTNRLILTKPDAEDYMLNETLEFGVYYCSVLPPNDLYIPVLPARVTMANKQEKLVFALCMKCAVTQNKDRCHHDDKERAITGVYTSVELNLALEKGYKILHVYEAQKFDQRYDLFSSYVNTFYKLKTIYSGYEDVIEFAKIKMPDMWKRMCEDVEHKDEKDLIDRCSQLPMNPLSVYCRHFSTRFGLLEPWEIKRDRDVGMRTVTKVILNSLWGKYGQRAVLTKQVATKKMEDLNKHLHMFNHDEIEDFDFVVHYNTAVMSYKQPLTKQRDNLKFNPYIAMFTTAHARVHLYNIMDKVDANAIYCDTDSVYWISSPLVDQKIQYGVFLGDFTNELKDARLIDEFFSSGPKSKCYTTTDPIINRSLKPTCKGIPMNYHNAELYKNKIKNIILHQGEVVLFPRNFVLQKDTKTGDVYERVGTLKKQRINPSQESEEELKSDDEEERFTTPSRKLTFTMDKRIAIKRYSPIRDPNASRNIIAHQFCLIDTVPYGFDFNVNEWRVIPDAEWEDDTDIDLKRK